MTLRGIALLVLLAFVCAPTTLAGEVEKEGDADQALLDRAATLTQSVAAHKKDRDLAALEADLREAVALFAATPEESKNAAVKKLRPDTVKLVGTLLKIQDHSHRLACFDALGSMGHKTGARYVKPYLKPVTGTTVHPLLKPAVETAGEIACSQLVNPLIAIVQKSKTAAVKVLAMKALANFRHCKRERQKILIEVVKHVKRYRPGRRRMKENKVDPSKGPIGAKAGDGSVAQWQALTAALPGVFNKLTGGNVDDAEAWITIVEENRRNLGVLFQDED